MSAHLNTEMKGSVIFGWSHAHAHTLIYVEKRKLIIFKDTEFSDCVIRSTINLSFDLRQRRLD